MAAFENIVEKLTRCPECKGEGGYREIILDNGLGPWYPCEFCDHGYMNVFKKIYWKILFKYYKWQEKRM